MTANPKAEASTAPKMDAKRLGLRLLAGTCIGIGFAPMIGALMTLLYTLLTEECQIMHETCAVYPLHNFALCVFFCSFLTMPIMMLGIKLSVDAQFRA